MQYFDNVGHATLTEGTGDITLGSVITANYHTLAEQGAVDGDRIFYRIDEDNDVELGIGTIGGSVTTISRDQILKSRIDGVSSTDKMVLAGNAQVTCELLSGAINDFAPGQVRVLCVDVNGGDPDLDYEAGATIDGVTLVAGKLLLRATSGGDALDGLYAIPAAGGSPASEASRPIVWSEYDDYPALEVNVSEGTTYADTTFRCTSNDGGTIDSTALTFVRRPIGQSMTAAEQRQALKDMGAPSHKISEASISAGQYVELTGLDWTEYPNGFEIVLSGTLPTTDGATLSLQENIGAGYLTGASDYDLTVIDAFTTTPGSFGDPRARIDLLRSQGNASQEMASGSIRIHPRAGGATAWYVYRFGIRGTSGEVASASGAGKRIAGAAGDPTSVRIYYSAGGDFIGQGSVALIGYF